MLTTPSITDLVASISSLETTNARALAIASAVANPLLNQNSLVRLSIAQDITTSGGGTIRDLVSAALPLCQLKTRLSQVGFAIFFGDIYVTRFPNVILTNSSVSSSYVNQAGGVIRASAHTGQIATDMSQPSVVRDIIATRIDWMNLAPPTANRNYSSFSLEGWLLLFGSNT